MLAILGVTLIAATAATGVAVGGDLGPGAEEVAAVLVSLMVNVVVFVTIFVFLTPRPHGVRELLPASPSRHSACWRSSRSGAGMST